MSSTRLKRTLVVWLALGGGVAATTGTTVYCLRDRLRAAHLASKLHSCPDEEAQNYIDRLATLGSTGLARIVQVLADTDREAVTTAAAKTLREQVAAWSASGSNGRAAAATTIVARLAAVYPRLRGPARPAALALVTDAVLSARGASATVCEQLRTMSEPILKSGLADAEPTVRREALAAVRRLWTASPETPSSSTAEAPSPTDTPPAPAEQDSRRAQAPFIDACLQCLADEDAGVRAEAVATVAATRNSEATQQILPLLDDPEPQVLRQALVCLGTRPDAVSSEALLVFLHHADHNIAALTAKILQQRGLTDREVELARRFSHTSPEVRAQLAIDLPQMKGIDQTVWLLHLSRDPEPTVRFASLASMLSSGDDQLRSRVRRIAADDPDEKVRQRAGQLLSATPVAN